MLNNNKFIKIKVIGGMKTGILKSSWLCSLPAAGGLHLLGTCFTAISKLPCWSITAWVFLLPVW